MDVAAYIRTIVHSVIYASLVANGTKRETARTPHMTPLLNMCILAQDHQQGAAQDHQQGADIEYPVDCLNP